MQDKVRLAGWFSALACILVVCSSCSRSEAAPQQGQEPILIKGFDDCIIDIRPYKPTGSERLVVEYKPQADGHDLWLSATYSGNDRFIYDDLGNQYDKLPSGTDEKPVTLRWSAAPRDKVTIDTGAKEKEIPSKGSYVATERLSSPCFEEEQDGEWLVIRCHFQGRTTTLRIK